AQHTVKADNATRVGWRAGIARLFIAPTFAAAVAILLIAIAVGILNTADPTLPRNGTDFTQARPAKIETDPWAGSVPQRGSGGSAITPRVKRKIRPIDQSDVLSSDLGYLDIYERDTARHIEQT